ncbi:hypothetical protein [Bacillus toyonensis]|uniref:hypothetical protein n=1 Tax=Bacillus toyonensis TaxID=155322 RepID=UPI0011AAD2F4|nr:hypothetical protein [Bacillus toyonensis]
MKENNVVGKKFGKLTAIKEFKGGHSKPRTILCRCECGNEKVVCKSSLILRKTQSCGCLRKYNSVKHNLRYTRIYTIWASMVQRCTDENASNYNRYGGRGISVCNRWKEFLNFYEDMKDSYSDSLSIDRIDNNLGYSKENCRWATPQEQALNRRSNRLVEINGEKLPITKACEILGIPYATVRTRLYRGWSIERALSKAEKNEAKEKQQ